MFILYRMFSLIFEAQIYSDITCSGFHHIVLLIYITTYHYAALILIST